jgi:hypothetical protein
MVGDRHRHTIPLRPLRDTTSHTLPPLCPPISSAPYDTRNRSVTIWAMVRPQATIRVLATLLGEAQDTLDKTIHN